MRNTVIALILAVGVSSCGLFSASKRLQETKVETLTKLVEMTKTPCYGVCPVYTVTVYTNGILTYEGKENTARQGSYIHRLPDNDLNALTTSLKNAKLFDMKDAYRGRMPDMQTISITYYEKGQAKKIVGKDGRPDKVMDVQKAMEMIARLDGWQLYVAANAPVAASTYDLPDYIVANEIRVQLQRGVDINAWVRKNKRYAMQVERPVSAATNYWLVSFNIEQNDPREVLGIVQADTEVVGAEFNRR